MYRFESWSDFLTFASFFDGIIFEKMDDDYGIVCGVMDDDIDVENKLAVAITNALMTAGDNMNPTLDPETFDPDSLKNFEGRTLLPTDIIYKDWKDWANDAVEGIRRDYVKIKGTRNIKSKVLKLSEMAKIYLDPKKFDYKNDNTYLWWK